MTFLESTMGHSPYAWSVLGAAAHAANSIGLMTYVTCPIKRYHPPVCFDPDRNAAVERAHRLFRCSGGGWNVNAELPVHLRLPRPLSSCAVRT